MLCLKDDENHYDYTDQINYKEIYFIVWLFTIMHPARHALNVRFQLNIDSL